MMTTLHFNLSLRQLISSLFCVMLLYPGFLFSQERNYQRYVDKSGIIEYEVTGYQSGTETLYFDDYGVREAKYKDLTMEMFGVKQKTNQIEYLDGYMQYTINLDDNTGTKIENTMLKQMVESSEGNDLGELGKKMLVSMGGEKLGEEQFLGKKCEVWQLLSMGTKVWIWNYIPLKTEMDMMGMKITYKATNVQINVSIPNDKIGIPSNIEFREIDMNNLQDLMKEKQLYIKSVDRRQ